MMFLLAFAVFTSCTKNEEKDGKNEVEDSSLTLTKEEEDDNWKYFKEIGFKVHMPKEISNKKDNISARVIGDEEDETSPIYKGYLYRYVSNSTNKAFDKIVADESLSDAEKREKINKEVRPRVKDLFALVTLRTPLITEENSIEKILNTNDITVLQKNATFTHAIVFDKGEDLEPLTEEEKSEFHNFMQLAKAITNGAKAGRPIPKKASLQTIEGLKFKTQDLAGNEVTSDVLKKAKVTMLNIWATWCPPCKAELPDIGELERKYREKGVQVIAICSDVTDEDDSALEEAKEIIKDAKCDFLVLRKNKSLDTIYSNIQAYPTTLFFDKNGNILGNMVVIGGRSEEQFAKLLDHALSKVEK